MKHALVVGVSGIVGHRLAEELLLRGDWIVSGVARKPTPYPHLNEKVNLIQCDLLNDNDVDKKLTPCVNSITHVFYCAWVPGQSDLEEQQRNLTMIKNVVINVDKASKYLQHVYLQTGTKYYGMHVGPARGCTTPSKETDPRLSMRNFYYDQEDFLKSYSKEKSWNYSVSRPPCIVGFAMNSYMNFGVNLAVYATVLKELGKPLIFPYSREAYHCLRESVDSAIVARFAIWQSSSKQAFGEAFNITNGDLFRCETMWPKIAKYFGMEWKVEEKGTRVSDFMKQHVEMWRRIGQKYGLAKSELSQFGDFGFMDFVLQREWDDVTDDSKARSFGFQERISSDEALFNLFDELQIKKVIPEVKGGVRAIPQL